MGKIRRLLLFVHRHFFRLNEKQRDHIAKLSHLLGLASALPIISKLLSNEQHSDDWQALGWLLYALAFEIIALLAMSSKNEED